MGKRAALRTWGPSSLQPAAPFYYLTDYPKQTMSRHQAAILNFYGFRAFKPYVRAVLDAEITRLVQSHLKPKLIFSRALDVLVREKVEVPGYFPLAALILTAINQHNRRLTSTVETFWRKSPASAFVRRELRCNNVRFSFCTLPHIIQNRSMADQDLQRSEISAVPVCGIGASAGGLEALQKFFGALPDDLGLAYVVILHLAPDRKSDLPAIIARWTRMPVIQVGDHDRAKLDANHVYVIAPDRKLEITDTSIGASKFEQARGQRAAIDLFFRSLAASHSDGFAVVLSGSGSDGALGARAVKEGGGLVLVQDPSEASHDDMPRAVIATGVADIVLPVRDLVARLAELVRSKESIVSVVRAAEETVQSDRDQEKALRGIFDLLREQTNHDFSKYKRNTVLRRLARRMQLCHQVTIADYLQYLRTHKTEIQQLFDDLLISVTSFFRDPESWEALQSLVVHPLVEHTDPDEQIRAWVPGCSTGEEAYSLAILFHEEFERRGIQRDLIIFASDVDESALAVAREGRYPNTISADVSELQLERYFHPEGDHYRIVSAVRDRVVFAAHSLLRDPPFSHQHLISCRNLLIYLDRELQEQTITVFRYACRDRAYLFLGSSEVADEGLFRAIDKKHRIFATREPGEGLRPPLPELLIAPRGSVVRREARPVFRPTVTEVHIAALEEVSPPSLLVDEQWNVLHLSASASRFLQQIGGPLTQRITDLVRPELRDEMHVLLHRAFEGVEPQLSSFISVVFNGASRRVALLVQPRPQGEGVGRQALVTFLDGGEAASTALAAEQEPTNELMRSLREKLREAELRIESVRDDYYLANEELRAANEELQSLNEEYRSTTEELETSKEELQSMNEELQTINHQLKLKLEEVSHANSDLENLMAATEVATLFLDVNCRISRFTPRLTEIFNIKPRDRERPISDLTHSLDYDALERDARSVLANSASIEGEVSSRDGRVFLTRLSPYRKFGGQVDGVVITFVDMTAIKQAETALRDSERKLEAELNVMRVLHRTTTTVMTATSVETMQNALEEILSAAIMLTGADFGNVQLLDATSRKLKVIVQRGFAPAFLEAFTSVGPEDGSACGRALCTRETVCIEDVTRDPEFAPYREIAVQAGFRAVQSEPLIGKGGELVGVFSIHFREPRAFSERDRRVGGLVARQTADLIINRTQQKKVAELNEALTRRTAELEASQEQLARQAAELLEQDRNKETFLAVLSHELRNPMAAIQNSLELLSPTHQPPQAAIDILKRQTRHMARLVNDLLDITRINRGRLEIECEMVDLNQCVLMAVDPVRHRAHAKGLALEVELPGNPIYVDADPERLLQILDNLLSNSLNYTERGSITISARRDTAHALIAIRDTGIGIDPSEIDALFNPLHQTKEGRHAGGLGLGLSLVRRLVELHGGRIEFHSEGRGLGSEITFTLPLSRSAAAAISPSREAIPPSRRILLIEDQPDAAEAFRRLLEFMGQQVRVAHTGEVALEIAREQCPQVAFVDFALPGMSGTEVARLLRQEFPSAELTLIALSGYRRDHPAFQNTQFEHHLLKPVAIEAVVALLNSLPADDMK
jgi:two-component system, chemotaxis family, CheB/CheR fusion protein